jgi:hypothetical protein
MKLTQGILAVVMMTGAACAYSADANGNQSNAAQGTAVVPAQPNGQAKPTPGAPAPVVKPAQIPGAKAAASETKPANPGSATPAVAPAKAAAKPTTASAASQTNRLEAVHVIHHADEIQIEISSREAVTPKVSTLTSPARLVVELPGTVIATSENKIAVGSAGVKGVRIGMDGKTPPTTSVVVDLEHAIGYDLAAGAGNKFLLSLHTAPEVSTTAGAKTAPAKSAPAAVRPVATKPVTATATVTKPAGSGPAPKVAAVAVPTVAAAKVASASKGEASKGATTTPVVNGQAPKVTVASVPVSGAKPAAAAATTAKETAKSAVASEKIAAQQDSASLKKAEAPKAPAPEAKKWAMTGKRDPFFSPVVQQSSGSGCSTGKKCLEIGQINVRGVVKSESGFIAVVTNSINKAYFLHENDPVFNGFVVKITGDSVVFQETMQDKLGKPFTREVTKRITTPAV